MLLKWCSWLFYKYCGAFNGLLNRICDKLPWLFGTDDFRYAKCRFCVDLLTVLCWIHIYKAHPNIRFIAGAVSIMCLIVSAHDGAMVWYKIRSINWVISSTLTSTDTQLIIEHDK